MTLTRFLNLKIAKLILFCRRDFRTSAHLHGALTDSPNAQLNRSLYNRYMELPIPDNKIQVCYVWIDGSGLNLRCKSRTFNFFPTNHEEVPNWSFDGSSTGQGVVHQSDCCLVPVAMYKDPFLRGNNKLVLCETYDLHNNPARGNHRQKCVATLSKVCDQEVQLGFEQEFVYLGPDGRPFGWPVNGEPPQDMLSYCGIGGNNVVGRAVIEAFYRCCLYCGIEIYGMNAEVMPTQWEFQSGPSLGIKAGDDVWMARFLLAKVAEDFGVSVTYEPKPYSHLSGSGMHVNFSTKEMRGDGGLKQIEEALKKLERTHKEHIEVYDLNGGEDNRKRLTGKNETSHIDKFTSGVGDRSASVRISLFVAQNKKGYFEDRRPASNADPYQIINVLVKSILL